MSDLKLPSLPDLIHCLGADVAQSRRHLVNLYERPKPPWSYNVSRSIAGDLFKGNVSLEAAVAGCYAKGHPSGFTHNAEVVKLLWPMIKDYSCFCRNIRPRQYYIRKDLYFRVHLPFYRVESNQVFFPWLQPRKRFAPSREQLGLLASIIKDTHLRDDFEDSEVEIFDLSCAVGSNTRKPRRYLLGDLPVLPQEELQYHLGLIARAFDQLKAMGYQPKPPKRKDEDSDGPVDDPGPLFR